MLRLWDRLRDFHSDHSQLNKNQTLAKFLNFKINPDESIVSQFIEIEELARALKDMGVEQNEQTVMMIVVSALPDPQFTMFKKAWHSVPEANQSMEFLLSRLRLEELENKKFSKDQQREEKKRKPKAFHSVQGKGQDRKKLSLEERKK